MNFTDFYLRHSHTLARISGVVAAAVVVGGLLAVGVAANKVFGEQPAPCRCDCPNTEDRGNDDNSGSASV